MSNYEGFDEAVKYAKAITAPNGTAFNASAEANLAKEFLRLLPPVEPTPSIEAAREWLETYMSRPGFTVDLYDHDPHVQSLSRLLLSRDAAMVERCAKYCDDQGTPEGNSLAEQIRAMVQ